MYLASLVMCCGFFMMYLVEELVHAYINSHQNKDANTSFTRVLSIRRKSNETVETNEPVTKNVEANYGDRHLPLSGDDTTVTALRGLLIVLALSIHELFEGLAVGLESSVRNVWYVFDNYILYKLPIYILQQYILTLNKIYFKVLNRNSLYT